MKIGVVGPGAVGSFYGARLCRSGHDVHFLLRSDYDVVRRNGVFVRSPQGDFRVQPHCAKQPEEIGPCDLVIVALKTTANEQFPVLLPPLVDGHTAILTLQNGLGNEEALAKLFPAEQILGGLCFVCLNRLEPGLIHHIDHGLIVLGEFQRPPQARTEEFAAMFRAALVNCRVSENLAQAHWEKLVWNIPFNGLGAASSAGLDAFSIGAEPARRRQSCLTTAKLLADPHWAGMVRELMLEVIAAARALRFPVSETLADKQIERTRTMGEYRPSTLVDFELGRPLELNSLFLEPLRLAQKSNVAAPRLEALCRVLRELDSPSAHAVS